MEKGNGATADLPRPRSPQGPLLEIGRRAATAPEYATRISYRRRRACVESPRWPGRQPIQISACRGELPSSSVLKPKPNPCPFILIKNCSFRKISSETLIHSTISKDHTAGSCVRQAELMAFFGTKIHNPKAAFPVAAGQGPPPNSTNAARRSVSPQSPRDQHLLGGGDTYQEGQAGEG